MRSGLWEYDVLLACLLVSGNNSFYLVSDFLIGGKHITRCSFERTCNINVNL